DGLDEHRIELVDCESIDKMPSFVRFFKELGITVIAVADADQPQKLAKVAAADPDVLLSWSTHKDWEGVVSGEADAGELAAGIETCRASLGEWEEHADQLRGCLIDRIGDAVHLAEATDVPMLIGGYDELRARSALACLLRGNSGLDFKSTIYARMICTQLTVLPPTATGMIDHVHRFAAGDQDAKGVHDL
ncbi:MAG TPA: TOPRIM nucleotidyl transferase/hydrolase domain-containing protein, partial [Solirubrobacteraceae bacterium]